MGTKKPLWASVVIIEPSIVVVVRVLSIGAPVAIVVVLVGAEGTGVAEIVETVVV
jgi:hypothetical protein